MYRKGFGFTVLGEPEDSVVDRHSSDADPDPELISHFDADPDPDPDWHQTMPAVYGSYCIPSYIHVGK